MRFFMILYVINKTNQLLMLFFAKLKLKNLIAYNSIHCNYKNLNKIFFRIVRRRTRTSSRWRCGDKGKSILSYVLE